MAKALFLEDLPIIGKYVRDLLANKVDKVEGKNLSTNDYTTEEKTKLEGLSNDYDDLTDKPSINGVTLSGNKTSSDIGINESAIAVTNLNTLGIQNKQLLKLTLERLKELNRAGTWNDNVYTHKNVTFTVNMNNGNVTSITANGTTTGISTLLVDTFDIQPNTKFIANGGCSDPNYEEGHQHNFYVDVGNQSIYNEEDYEVETDANFLSYAIFVLGTAHHAVFEPMVRTVGNSYYVPYKKTINERIDALESGKITTLTTSCSCSVTDHDGVGTFTASFSYADIKAKGIDIDNTNNGFNIIKYIFWKEQTVDSKTYKLSFPDGMETFKIENISMSYNFDGEKISSIDFEGIYKPQESVDAPTNYMNLDIILVNR